MAAHFTILFFGEPACPPAGAPTLAQALAQARRVLASCRPHTRAKVIASDGRSWDLEVESHGVVFDAPTDQIEHF